MSNYIKTIKDKKTGKNRMFCAFDNYFGRHHYGYQELGDIGGKVFTEDEFLELCGVEVSSLSE